MEQKPVEVQPYLPDEKRWVIKPMDKFMGRIEDRGLIFEMWLTPQAPEDTSYCIFMCTVIKEAVNSRFGKVLDCAVTYGYKVIAEGATLNPKFLYDLQLLSIDKFKEEYEKRNKNTHVAHYLFDKPTFEESLPNLERVFLMRGVGRN